MRRPVLLVSTLFGIAACGDVTRSVGPVMGNLPRFAISDGANTGGGPANGDFFFLPPMVPDPSGALTFDEGAFDATLAPRVAICQLTAVEPRECTDPPIRVFSSDAITVSTTDEHYQVDWHTDLDGLLLDQLYRIQVQLPRHSHDGQERFHTIGYADVDPVDSGKELRNLATGEVIGLVDGRTLPIKFRIERSPRCGDSDDCVEAIVSDDGGRVETETGYAIAEFPAGWLPDEFDQVVVSIRRVAIGAGTGQEPSCHGTAHVQYEGCYDFETFPDVGTFDLPAVVSTCIEPDAGAYEPFLQLAASDDGANFRLLPPRTVTIECEGFEGTSTPVGFLDRIGERMLALGARLGVSLVPRALYAVDQGRGGAIDDFSHGGWVLPVSLSRLSPSDEVTTAAVGAAVPVSIVVLSAHESIAETGSPLAGLPVTFSLSDGGGSLDVAVALTNADGVVSTTWTMGAEGEHVLTASVADVALTVPITAVPALPDLIVSSGAPTLSPTSVLPGGSVQLSPWTVANIGPVTSGPNFSNGFYLSTDAVITSGDVVLGSNSNSFGALNDGGGQFDWGGPSLSIPPATAPGPYYVGILVDHAGSVAELDESNNYVSTPLCVIDDPIAFDFFPGCAATSLGDGVTDQWAVRGVVFSFTIASYAPPGEYPSNLQVGSTPTASGVISRALMPPGSSNDGSYTGTLHLSLSGAPTSVRMTVRYNAELDAAPVVALAPTGEAIPESSVSRSRVTFTNPNNGLPWAEEIIAVTNAGGLASIALPGEAFVLRLDDVQITSSPVID